MNIQYGKLVPFLHEKNGLHVLESTYLGDGILGRFFEPNIILIDYKLCRSQEQKQKEILVLLHETCHWFKWQEHEKDHKEHDEEACFEFENICDLVLNCGYSINHDFEAIKRLNLEKPMAFLKEVMKTCPLI